MNFRRNKNSLCFLFFFFSHSSLQKTHTKISLPNIIIFEREICVNFAAAASPAAAGSGRLAADQQRAAAGRGIPRFSRNALTAAAQMKRRSGSNAEKGHLVIFSERSKKITAEFVGLRAAIVRVAFGRGVGLVQLALRKRNISYKI